jgi:hypothetical protein
VTTAAKGSEPTSAAVIATRNRPPCARRADIRARTT